MEINKLKKSGFMSLIGGMFSLIAALFSFNAAMNYVELPNGLSNIFAGVFFGIASFAVWEYQKIVKDKFAKFLFIFMVLITAAELIMALKIFLN